MSARVEPAPYSFARSDAESVFVNDHLKGASMTVTEGRLYRGMFGFRLHYALALAVCALQTGTVVSIVVTERRWPLWFMKIVGCRSTKPLFEFEQDFIEVAPQGDSENG